MGSTADIVVAGAGALGATIAAQLAPAGHRVRVFDRAPPEARASGVAAGMLAPAFEALFDETSGDRFQLLKGARDRWPALARSIGLELDQGGAVAAGERDEVEAWAERMAAMGAHVEARAPDEMAALGLRPGWSGVFTADDWRLDPSEALIALRRHGVAAGVSYDAAAVSGFERGSPRFSDSGLVRADLLIIATGASRSLARLAPELACVRPIKGHILRAAGPALPPAPAIRGAGAYLCRTSEGLILGASMEAGRDDAAIDPAVVADLIARGERLAPGLGELDWRARVGVRAEAPDGLPLVGWSSTPGVMLAVGARRNGWLLAPLIAEIIADLIDGRPAPAEASLFDPARLELS